jgi:hypothetical protein
MMPCNRLVWLKDFTLGAFVSAVVLFFLACPIQANGPVFLESYRDPLNSKHVFAVFDTVSPDGAYLLHSLDGGQTWATIEDPRGQPVKMGCRQNFDQVFVRAAPLANPRIIITYQAGGDDIWRASADPQWKSIKRGLPSGVITRLELISKPSVR